jgi:hypothetical protein
MLCSTLKEYKNNYKSNLSTYLKEYDDYTPTSFLEMEMELYTAYYNSFIKIFDKLKGYNEDELKRTFFNSHSDAFNGLRKLNIKTYDDFVVKEKKHIQYNEDNDPSGLITIIIIDFKKLKNYFTSSELILKFISEQQQSNVPGDTIEVKVESKKEHEKSEVVEDIGSNDLTKSTIEDCLVDIIDDINNDDYKILVDALCLYFTTDKFQKLKHKIRFKSVNKKKVGWALKEIYKNLKMEKLSIEYFQFAKDNINLFEKEEIDNEDFKNSRFYKYFTTNPTK